MIFHGNPFIGLCLNSLTETPNSYISIARTAEYSKVFGLLDKNIANGETYAIARALSIRKGFQKPLVVLARKQQHSFFRLVQYCLSLNFTKMSSEAVSSMIFHILSGMMHQI